MPRKNRIQRQGASKKMEQLKQLKHDNEVLQQRNNELGERLKAKEKEITTIRQTIKNLMETERTHLGYNALKQAYEAITE